MKRHLTAILVISGRREAFSIRHVLSLFRADDIKVVMTGVDRILIQGLLHFPFPHHLDLHAVSRALLRRTSCTLEIVHVLLCVGAP